MISKARHTFTPSETAQTLLGTWGLLAAVLLVMLGNGLLSTLVGVRAEVENFPTLATGLVMSAYFAGFLFGAWVVPKLVVSVGHIRVYAALASLASTAALVYVLWIDPWSWAMIRLVTGFCLSGLFIVPESWLNESASNKNRGRLLSVYMVAVMGGIAAGQLLLTVADPNTFVLFIVSSVLVSLAIVPVTLSASPTPDFRVPSSLPIRQVWERAPLGIFAGVGHGLGSGALLGMGAVYASRVGMSVSRIALFMGLAIAGSVFLQWPLGAMSDSIQRRTSILLVALASGLLGVIATFIDPNGLEMLVVVFLVGGFTFPLYSLTLSHINDNMPTGSTVGVSSLYVLVVGLGAVFGPLVGALAMDRLGPNGLFWTMSIANGMIALIALGRMGIREALAVERQLRHSIAPARSGAIILELAQRHQRPSRRKTSP